jgi:hypothetical protein
MSGLKKVFLLTSAFFCLEALCWAETLRVQVVDAKTGAPVQATVNAIGTLPRLESVRTNQEGVAVLDLPSLERVSAIVKTSTHGEKCVAEEETKEGILVVRMEPSLRIFGVVRYPSGNPLRQATVKVVYKDDPKCRIRFDHADEFSNERGEYVLRNVDLTRDPTIVVRHDLYAERAIPKSAISAAPSGPSSNTKELNVDLAERP